LSVTPCPFRLPLRRQLLANAAIAGSCVGRLRCTADVAAVGAYSPRAREGIPIAAPVSWKQVGILPDALTMERPFRRA
jgi:hypothetical protein